MSDNSLKYVENEMLTKYYEYLESHIKGVKKAFEWLLENIPSICDEYDADELQDLIRSHDRSKYQDAELYAYANYFYGEKTAEVKKDFDYAWLHHQHNNPHHWQHWLLQNDEDGLKILEMPQQYLIEMICDWWAFSWVKGDLFEIFNWYEQNKKKIKLHETSRKFVEDTLDKIKKTLIETQDTDSEV